MADYGIKASKKGEDVKSASNDKLSFSSSLNTLKIKTEYTGSVSITVSTEIDWNDESATINHNLGYRPIVMLYYKDPSSSRWIQGPSVIPGSNSTPLGYQISGTYEHTSVNQIVLTFSYFRDTGDPGTINILYKLYLLLEPRKDAWYN